MFNYRNEAAFSKAVCTHLRKNNWFVQRIETGSIGRGVPDIYAISPAGDAWWLELKRVHTTADAKLHAKIPWRPGQQAWLHTASIYRQNVSTLVAFDDCIVVVSHEKIWQNDIINMSQCKKIPSISAL